MTATPPKPETVPGPVCHLCANFLHVELSPGEYGFVCKFDIKCPRFRLSTETEQKRGGGDNHISRSCPNRF